MSLSPSRFLSRFANRLVNHRWCAVENAWTFDLRRSTKDFSPAPCGKLFKIAGTSAARSRAPRRCLIIVVSRVRGDGDFVTAYTSVNSRKMTFVRQDEGGKTSGDRMNGDLSMYPCIVRREALEESRKRISTRLFVIVANKSRLFRMRIRDRFDYYQ